MTGKLTDKINIVSDNKPSSGNLDVKNTLNTSFFRSYETKKKINFCIKNTDIDLLLVHKAILLSSKNPYHNFDHQVGVAQIAVQIAQSMGLSRSDINLLAIVGLFHDALHTGKPRPDDEELAFQNMVKSVDKSRLLDIGCELYNIHDLFIATKFSLRGSSDAVLAQIIQDAYMEAVIQGPYYMLYATMGLIDEGEISLENYMDDQLHFFADLEKIHPNIFLSPGAKELYIDPRISIQTILSWPQKVIDYAYTVRYQDIQFDDFKKHIDAIVSQK